MASSGRAINPQGSWTSLWIVALISLFAQLWLCQFFSLGDRVPLSLDVDPCNIWKYAYQAPPAGEYLVLNWLGIASLPPPMNPFSLGAHLPPWLFFTTYAPIMAMAALLAMAAFLRELDLPRPAALFGAVIYAWQGDLLPFVFPGHYGYIATWPFFAVSAWGALRSQRTGYWPYALISGASCGVMVGLQPDRGAIASLLIAALYLAPAWKYRPTWVRQIRNLVICAGAALCISLAAFLALFQSFIVGVSMGGETDPEQTYKFDTQFSLGPEETLTYLVPGFFGWHSSHPNGPYWGRIGERSDWTGKTDGPRGFNLAISTTGTIPTALALLACALLLVPHAASLWSDPHRPNERQLFFARILLALGALGLVLSWGYHMPLYRLLYALPLMDKWRNPLKWLEMTNFAAVTLSAFGLQFILGLFSPAATPECLRARRRVTLLLDAILGLLIFGLIASYVFIPSLADYMQAGINDPSLIPPMIGTMHASLLIAIVLAALACALVRIAWNPGRLRDWTLENPTLNRAWKSILQPDRLPLALAIALAFLSAAQLFWVSTKFLLPVDLDLLTMSTPLVEELKSEGNTVRASVFAQDPTLNRLLQNQFNTTQISCLEISAASRVPDALNTFLHNFDDDPARLWVLAGVKNRVIPQAAFNQTQSDSRIKSNMDHVDGYVLDQTGNPNLPSHALIQFRDYLAKATFIPSAEILPDEEQLSRMRDPKWNPRATILLNAPRELDVEKTYQVTPALNLTTYDSHDISFDVQTPISGYVLINDAYDPDWRVQVNGADAPLLRADYLLRAVAVPGGNSTVSLHYVAHYHVGSLNLPAQITNELCDAAMILAWIVAGVALWRRSSTV